MSTRLHVIMLGRFEMREGTSRKGGISCHSPLLRASSRMKMLLARQSFPAEVALTKMFCA